MKIIYNDEKVEIDGVLHSIMIDELDRLRKESLEAFNIEPVKESVDTLVCKLASLQSDLNCWKDSTYAVQSVLRRELTRTVEIVRKLTATVQGMTQINLAQMERMKFLEARIEGMEKHLASRGMLK